MMYFPEEQGDNDTKLMSYQERLWTYEFVWDKVQSCQQDVIKVSYKLHVTPLVWDLKDHMSQITKMHIFPFSSSTIKYNPQTSQWTV